MELSAEPDFDAVRTAVTGLGYTVASVNLVNNCPRSLQGGMRDPWANTDGVDAAVISHGERVELSDHRVEGKFTIIDFGAPWCGPCHEAARDLKVYLGEHDDTAVRAVTMGGNDPDESYSLPVAKQHLQWVDAIPYFIVFDRNGKTVYKGAELDALILAIDKRRGRI